MSSCGGRGHHAGRLPAIFDSLESCGPSVVLRVRARRSLRSMTVVDSLDGAGAKRGILRGRRTSGVVPGAGAACGAPGGGMGVPGDGTGAPAAEGGAGTAS